MAILYPSREELLNQNLQPTRAEWQLIDLLSTLDDSFEIYHRPFLNGDNPPLVLLRKWSGFVIFEIEEDFNSVDLLLEDIAKKSKRIPTESESKELPRRLNSLERLKHYKDNMFDLHINELKPYIYKDYKNYSLISTSVFLPLVSSNAEATLSKELQPTQSLFKYVFTFFADSLNSDTLNFLVDKFRLNKRTNYFNEDIYNKMRRYLKPPYHRAEEGKQNDLSKEQQILSQSTKGVKQKIKGVAGCGKTIVLANRVVDALSRENSNVLVLCFNITLVNYIKQKVWDVKRDFSLRCLTILNYHQFFIAAAIRYKLKIHFGAFEDVDFFAFVRDDIQKYDAIFIDEMQDFEQEWFDIVVKYFKKDDSEFVVFGDEKQNIYQRNTLENKEVVVKGIPGAWNKSLKRSHRFNSSIAKIAQNFQKNFFSEKYIYDEIEIDSSLDFGNSIIEYHYFHSLQIEMIVEVINNVQKKHDIHPSDVGILGSSAKLLKIIDRFIRKQKNEITTVTFPSIEEEELVKANVRKADATNNSNNTWTRNVTESLKKIERKKKLHFTMRSGTVKLSTIQSFKGWEVDTLFLIVESDSESKIYESDELTYTGLTRAKHNLIIFNIQNARLDEFFQQHVEEKFQYDPYDTIITKSTS